MMETILAPAERRVKGISGLRNFRDIGGLPTQDGRRMKTGVLFRSDEPHRFTPEDILKVQALNLKWICDLRAPSERKSRIIELGGTSAEMNIVNVPFYFEERDLSRSKSFWMLIKSAHSIDLDQMMRDFYRRIAFESTEQIQRIFTMLAEENGLPALIHCTGGKDRTGMISAFIQLLAGVSRKDVVDDYLLSNLLNEQKIEQSVKALRVMSFFRLSRERLMPLLEARREYLEGILDEIFQRHSSIEDYLVQACGVQTSALSRLKASLLD